MNDHQKCVFLTYKEKYEKTKQELISLQAGKMLSSAEGEESNTTKESMVHLEDELRMVGVIVILWSQHSKDFKFAFAKGVKDLGIKKVISIELHHNISIIASLNYFIITFEIFNFKQKELCQQVQVQLNDSRQEIQVLILDNFTPSLGTSKGRLIPIDLAYLLARVFFFQSNILSLFCACRSYWRVLIMLTHSWGNMLKQTINTLNLKQCCS